MDYKDYFGIGVAGNFTGHLEQANEAEDFLSIKVKEENQPKAIFPFYFPNLNNSFLSIYPISSSEILLPKISYNVQIEPEVAIICDVSYQDNKVVGITPKKFGAYNDCSIRRADAKKISHKKNWGVSSKGLSDQLIDINSFTKGSRLDQFAITSFHKTNGDIFQYGETSAVSKYSYNYGKLLSWIIDRLNNQPDQGPAENITHYLNESGYPKKCIISIGATRYTSYGQKNFLKPGDTSIVVVFDKNKYSFEDILAFVHNENYVHEDVSFLVQNILKD